MNNIPVVLYTHTDMKDVWPAFFGRLKKYTTFDKLYVFVNKKDDALLEYDVILYDDSKMYTERLLHCIDQLEEEVFLFIHEDMILYDIPNHKKLESYYSYIKNKKADSIKLIYVGQGGIRPSFDVTLINNEFAKFSIQPTIIRKDHLLNILKEIGPLNIWDFEKSISVTSLDFMAYRGDENKRGMHHYDSFAYPYIATAINKGKWNVSEYEIEMNSIFEEYNINPYKRGTV